MLRRHRLLFICATFSILGFIAAIAPAFAINYTPIDYPGSVATFAQGIDGNSVVGYYDDGTVYHGFLFDGSTYTTIDDPLGADGTLPFGISGITIVGAYNDASSQQHGYLYDGSTYKTLDDPLANDANPNVAYGISGGKIVGRFGKDDRLHGYLYDGATFTTIDDPNAAVGISLGTTARGIDGDTIVGFYRDASDDFQSFIYNGTTYTELTSLFGVSGIVAENISGGTIVGSYQNHGFAYDGTSFITVDIPAALNTFVHGISGNRIVGTYIDSSGSEHSFIATVPEPSSLTLLLGVGLVSAFKFLQLADRS